MESGCDSGWSWVVLTCVLLSQVAMGGICLTGGVMYVIIERQFGENPVGNFWLCAMPFTMWFLSPPLGSFLTNRYGYRVCGLVGTCAASLGLMLSFFVKHRDPLFATYGFLTGFGLGIHYTSGYAALNDYFDKYKVLATGIASIGNNVGLVAFSKLISVFDRRFSFSGTMLILGGLMLNLCPLSIAFIPRKCTQKVNEIKGLDDKKCINIFLLKNLSFVSWIIANFFTNISLSIYFLQLPAYSIQTGFTEENFSILWLSYGVSNIVGKVVFSALAQSPRVNTIVLYTVCLATSGLVIGLTPVLLTQTGVLVLTGCMGFFSCVTGALIAAVTFEIVGFENFADGMGLVMPFKSFGNLIGGPLGGLLLSSTGTYSVSFYTAGSSMLLASLFVLYPELNKRFGLDTYRSKRKLKSELRVEKNTVAADTCETEALTQRVINIDIKSRKYIDECINE